MILRILLPVFLSGVLAVQAQTEPARKKVPGSDAPPGTTQVAVMPFTDKKAKLNFVTEGMALQVRAAAPFVLQNEIRNLLRDKGYQLVDAPAQFTQKKNIYVIKGRFIDMSIANDPFDGGALTMNSEVRIYDWAVSKTRALRSFNVSARSGRTTEPWAAVVDMAPSSPEDRAFPSFTQEVADGLDDASKRTAKSVIQNLKAEK
ncbi:MAG: hypothetical protein SFY92_09080 [Verrucomicrobiae bacterium]|nr:hypothetical protein [Verrucomicrobiae bacterium]